MTWQATIDTLRQRGCWLGGQWHGMHLAMTHLLRSPTFTGHVIPQGDRTPRSFEDALANPAPHLCYPMETTLAAPTLFEFIVLFHGLAADYFQEEPLLYSVNAFWKKPSGPSGWHYDEDDRKTLVMFIYGTDVLDDTQGVHQYVIGSQDWPREKLKWIHNVEETKPPGDWEIQQFTGPSGTFFVTDTRGLHNGFPPRDKARLLLWARWGVSDPPISYKWDELSPVDWRKIGLLGKPAAEVQQRTRLVVDWSA